ncbi:hypothetical protein VOLCADRAFT_107827 [Volvox carteri f. nagariensis]|uniref:Uncharacterized protein n=1 Tax=Volvox carteri f. nagariensis TaxID=3068 RepID=D8UGQ0_VOLCA|nr:uncharacterized protein VOLCADRAFT_107827 [Volvox carteri f. nagariensis]EFJ41069.1 hypothetical protein VOLCADRAFT_107827 [Volvox carteri f. nagariensis]|eukprot:XP_002957832.1 hypothetical protein VOLCADRAFT_107827 [Volvox carteri f. nagariensis]
MNALEKVSEKHRRDDRATLEQADELCADFMANEQKVPRDVIGHRLQAFTGFHLGLQLIHSYLDAGCYEKAAEWTDRLQLRAEIGMEVTHQLASEPRIGLTATDHCFNNIIGTRIPKGEKAEALVCKQKDWALRTASASTPGSHGGSHSHGAGGSGRGSGGGSRGSNQRGGGQHGGHEYGGGRDAERFDRSDRNGNSHKEGCSSK